jgi:hypothetical protein
MNTFKAFIESPANRTGISIWLGTAITMGAQYFLFHVRPSPADLLGIVLGFVQVIQPENSVTVSQMQKAIADLSKAITEKTSTAIGVEIGDVANIVAGVTVNHDMVGVTIDHDAP